MSDKEIERTLEKLRKFRERLAGDKEASKKFLVDTGIITSEGKLTELYQNLCIPQGQA